MRAALKILALGLAVLVSIAAPTAHASVTVTLTAPTDGTVYPNAAASITLAATASAGQGYSVTQVDFYAGTTLIGSSTVAPYSVTWNNAPAGTYSLTAQATATKNNGATQTATSNAASVRVNAAPSVDITAPAPNAVFNAPATTTVTASASDTDGTITQVEFFANGVSIGTATAAPFSVQWANVAAGSYNLTAVATDNDGATTTSAAVPVLVNALPSVSITSPANNATLVSPASITITADATDSDGTISRVDFYEGTTLLGSATASPYTYDWTNVARGTYALTAHAIDNNNGETVSAPVNVTVNAPASTLYFIEPDHLNTPRVVEDATQKVVWRWDQQEPFGDSAPNEDPDGNSVTFTFPSRYPGQYADAETGLQYNYFRDYDAGVGRYAQSDPIALAGGMNTFAYVGGDPLVYSDPRGKDLITGAIGLVVGGWAGYEAGGLAGAAAGAVVGGLVGIVAPWASEGVGGAVGGSVGILVGAGTNVAVGAAGGATASFLGNVIWNGMHPNCKKDLSHGVLFGAALGAFAPLASGEALAAGVAGVEGEASVGGAIAGHGFSAASGVVGVIGAAADPEAEHGFSSHKKSETSCECN